MKLPLFATAMFAALASTSAAAFSVGTYQLDDSAVASSLLSGSGMAYNGTDYYWGSGSSWQINTGSGWTGSAAPSELTDTGETGATTFLAATPDGGLFDLTLGFDALANGDGNDLAFFFLFDQSQNAANVTINGQTQSLALSDVHDDQGDQQVANGVIWNGDILDNVRLMVGEADLDDFGVAAGAAWGGGVSLSLLLSSQLSDSGGLPNVSPDPTQPPVPMALSMAAALNTEVAVVPVPAAVWLFGSGLLGLIGVARKARSA